MGGTNHLLLSLMLLLSAYCAADAKNSGKVIKIYNDSFYLSLCFIYIITPESCLSFGGLSLSGNFFGLLYHLQQHIIEVIDMSCLVIVLFTI